MQILLVMQRLDQSARDLMTQWSWLSHHALLQIAAVKMTVALSTDGLDHPVDRLPAADPGRALGQCRSSFLASPWQRAPDGELWLRVSWWC